MPYPFGFSHPDAIIELIGPYLSQAELLEAHGLLAYVDKHGLSQIEGHDEKSIRRLRKAVRATRAIAALNDGRIWARRRLAERLSPRFAGEIAIAVVPSHDPFRVDAPIRLLAQAIVRERDRLDATACLVRHTKINRIVFGGESHPRLHKETIAVQNVELIAGRNVLLLDDICKSGASLVACRALLYQAGATLVQAAALGAVLERDE